MISRAKTSSWRILSALDDTAKVERKGSIDPSHNDVTSASQLLGIQHVCFAQWPPRSLHVNGLQECHYFLGRNCHLFTTSRCQFAWSSVLHKSLAAPTHLMTRMTVPFNDSSSSTVAIRLILSDVSEPTWPCHSRRIWIPTYLLSRAHKKARRQLLIIGGLGCSTFRAPNERDELPRCSSRGDLAQLKY